MREIVKSSAFITFQALRLWLLIWAALFIAASAAQTAGPPSSKSLAQRELQRGQEAVRQGDLPRARTEFEKALHHAPNDPETQAALGWVLAQQGEGDASLAHLRAALKTKPAFVQARLTLATVLE